MKASKEPTEPTETSPLLVKDASKPVDGSLGVLPDGPVENGNPVCSSDSGVADEEVGETEDADNPVFNGLPEVAARLHWLLPAVGIGVCSIFNFTTSINDFG